MLLQDDLCFRPCKLQSSSTTKPDDLQKNLGTQNGNSNHYLHELCAQGTLQCDSFLLLQNYTQNCLQKSMFHQMLHGA